MRRSLAILAASIALSALPAGAREPLDFDLARLGPPSPAVWLWQLPCQTAAACSAAEVADAAQMAGDARIRFARLAADLALGLTSTLSQPASTTGHSGFQFDVEASYAGVRSEAIGSTNTTFDAAHGGGARPYWPTRITQPSELLAPSFHLRKGLPMSFEVGGRLTYLAQSSYFAAQLEGKWSFLEGYADLPELAVRVSWTKLVGQKELELSASEIGFLASKRFGVGAVTSLTPYLAARLTRVNASSKTLAYGDVTAPLDPDAVAGSYAAFPDVGATLYRTTLGVRLTSYAVALAGEATYYGGGTMGKATPGAGDYPKYFVPASIAGSLKFGFEF